MAKMYWKTSTVPCDYSRAFTLLLSVHQYGQRAALVVPFQFNTNRANCVLSNNPTPLGVLANYVFSADISILI